MTNFTTRIAPKTDPGQTTNTQDVGRQIHELSKLKAAGKIPEP